MTPSPPARLATLTHGPVPAAGGSGGAAVERRAVRAVVLDGEWLLLLQTARGAVKFPGGGVEPGESDEQALRREVREECGLEVTAVLDDLGTIVEVAAARPQDGAATFRMTSRYLRCRVGRDQEAPGLSPDEQALGLRTVRMTVAQALAANAPFAADGSADGNHRFTVRESLALQWLAEAPR
ncbi:NUDIX hydrolase [Nocardioides mesophilus]|uniref:NUDIX domain-containing protein n=1 Tax=Nocardioides mesophilus TaxID=433659 RepID=A0A7G9RBC1_9ACTN|nr:NUDIX domain-containing protein [Nocardioides mesophilus]QNN52896.1 NUDIX domain-containing protein [Nocardioides mesophilus]